MKFTKFWLLLALLGHSWQHSAALRCYTCENCDEHAELKELEVCSVPPSTQQQQQQPPQQPQQPPQQPQQQPPQQPAAVATQPSTSPAAVPATATGAATVPATVPATSPATSPAAAPANPAARPPATTGNSDYEEYDSDENESGTGTGAGTATAPGAASAPAAAAPAPAAAANSEDYEEEDEDYDERRRRSSSARQAAIPATRAVCYIASLQNNGTEITNRGCTLVMDGNLTAACSSLFHGWDVVGCQVCDLNGCNAPIHGTVIGQFHSDSWRPYPYLGRAVLLLAMVSYAYH